MYTLRAGRGEKVTPRMLIIQGLTKRFGARAVVDDLSLTVARGEVLGFLGPNGAGKTTTMRMVCGMTEPDAGDALIDGVSITSDRARAQVRLGYLPEGAPLYLDMTPLGFLRFLADARRLARDVFAAQQARVTEALELGPVLHAPISTLSKGFRRRVALAGAILHDPPVLILDEPTDGLDPNQKRAVHRLISELSGEKAILISTHNLDEVETMCSRAVIVNRGKIVDEDTPEGFLYRHPDRSFAHIFAAATGQHEEVRA